MGLESVIAGAMALGVVIPLAAQAPADAEWDVTKPRDRTRTIEFPVAEGTWTSLDVSPDGQRVVFDLLSSISRIPNGNPRRTSGTVEIHYVMKGATLYDAMSLDGVWSTPRRYGDTYWALPETYRRDVKPVTTWDR